MCLPTRQGIKEFEHRESIPIGYIENRSALVLATRKSLITGQNPFNGKLKTEKAGFGVAH